MARTPKLLQLSDDDLRAIGEVAAQWSLANAILEMLLIIMASNNPKASHLIAKRLKGFDTKADACKTVFKTCFDAFPLHKKIGLTLMSRGKEISTERNIALHWPASRAGSITLQFADTNFWAAATKRDWTIPQLLALADTISDWTMDGPLASQATWHGPRIDMGTLT
jgi:hypothetical protein